MKDYSCLRTLLPMGMFGTGDLMVRPTGHVHEFDRPDPARDKLGLFLTFGSASDQVCTSRIHASIPLFNWQGPYGLPDPPSGASSPLLCMVLLSQRAGLRLSTHSRPLPFDS
ncbi:BQ5605_C006g04144 [Microbotryum silenes-dioicae]|uniref:BQ5605_C006g04144 protein n=1 Tax=Microbotryum silenes-dioicae TaxID=796604 RepID=A0A2X0MA91_9BASI|nr:BQ5605_C006g04144 [Microbotryum silenes-dioicae]